MEERRDGAPATHFRRQLWSRRRLLSRLFQHFGVFLVWMLAAGFALFQIPAPLGALVALLLAWLLLHGYLLRTGRSGEQRRWATLRLRAPGPQVRRWTLVAVPVLLVLSWALGEVYTGMVPVPADYRNPYSPLTATLAGRLSLALLAIGVAPIIEEFFFRGLIQHPLERRWGATPAILATAAIFAFIHLLPWIFPLHFFLGVVFGWVVYATRSIWPAVILHAANNSAALLGIEGTEDLLTPPTIWEAGPDVHWWTALAVLAVSLVPAAWVARRLWEAGRARGS